MKKTLIIAALAATVSTGAFAQSSTVTQAGVIGPQANIQNGDHNLGVNSADINLNANASAYSSRLYPGIASTTQGAQTGPQTNFQNGIGNFGLNHADINLNANANTWGSGNAAVGQTGLTVGQLNDQFGYGNVGVNSGSIYANGNAYSDSYRAPVKVYPVKEPKIVCQAYTPKCGYDVKMEELVKKGPRPE